MEKPKRLLVPPKPGRPPEIHKGAMGFLQWRKSNRYGIIILFIEKRFQELCVAIIILA